MSVHGKLPADVDTDVGTDMGTDVGTAQALDHHSLAVLSLLGQAGSSWGEISGNPPFPRPPL